ncbi:MAG: alpha/beta hydrolase [Micrococcales bacterium]|nr:alpha/beta hydrolase [Micrococcales bacterium]
MDDDSILDERGRAPRAVTRYGEHPDQVIELRGDSAAPPIVVVHGGYWRPEIDRAHAGPMSDALAEAGFAVATIEYRRVPGDPDATVDDVRSALTGLKSALAGPPVVVGHSAGGHLALLAAATLRIRAAVALGPVASLRLADALHLGDDAARAFLGGAAEGRADLDPRELADPPVPVTIVHGEEDEVVPLAVSAAYLERHRAARLVQLAGVGHFGVIDPRTPAFARVVDEVRALAG